MQEPELEQRQFAWAVQGWRTYLMAAVAVLAVVALLMLRPLLGWLLLGSGSPGSPGSGGPSSPRQTSASGAPVDAVRAVVRLLQAGETAPRAYEPYFADKAVAAAVAEAVGRGDFPRKLAIKSLSAEVGSTSATVTVLWNMKRPSVAENGSQFFLKRVGAAWVITDAAGKQIGPRSEEFTSSAPAS